MDDKMIEDEGELYDGEKEGGDLKNQISFAPQKRPASSPNPSISPLAASDIKKSKVQDDTETEENDKSLQGGE